MQKALAPEISTWLEFGMDVELTMVPFTTDADGNELVTFAFQPV
jgi:hypothetical protein